MYISHQSFLPAMYISRFGDFSKTSGTPWHAKWETTDGKDSDMKSLFAQKAPSERSTNPWFSWECNHGQPGDPTGNKGYTKGLIDHHDIATTKKISSGRLLAILGVKSPFHRSLAAGWSWSQIDTTRVVFKGTCSKEPCSWSQELLRRTPVPGQTQGFVWCVWVAMHSSVLCIQLRDGFQCHLIP